MNTKRHFLNIIFYLSLLGAFLASCQLMAQNSSVHPGSRTLLDAHNCYPYGGKWTDRMDRALSCGVPLAIEQDLVWYTDRGTGKSWSIVSHGKPYKGDEPTLRNYFFERIRPIMENALFHGNEKDFPLIILNLDFKTHEPEHYRAIWKLLGEYEDWLCTAERVADEHIVMPLDVKPLLVLTGSGDDQKRIFHDVVEIGERLRLFGAVHVYQQGRDISPEKMVPDGATNYRRWWNNSWSILERTRRNHQWTEKDSQRLAALVEHAHKLGLWIRFYTLNGHEPGMSSGWSEFHNFGSEKRVNIRWRAAIEAGVDFIATDQYELFNSFKAQIH